MCTRPKKAFQYGLTPEGKPNFIISSHDTHCYRIMAGGKLRRYTVAAFEDYQKAMDKFTTAMDVAEWIFDWFPVRCGKCPECKLEDSRTWANRLMMEKSCFDHAYFLTLTYDDDHVPISFVNDPDTAEIADLNAMTQTLDKTDVQKWMKRLRKAFADLYGSPLPYPSDPDDPLFDEKQKAYFSDKRRVRYYLCGEYGSTTFRPHYHCILFSPPIPDYDSRVLVGRSETGGCLYNTAWLSETWRNGFITVSEVTWETCAYVARYCLKKRYGAEKDFYAVNGIEPEFSLQSTRPGIGAQYYFEHPGLLDFDFITLSTEKKGIKFAPPRYFRKLHERQFGESPDKYIKLQQARERDEHLLDNSTLSYDEYMEVRERAIGRRLTQLRRSLEDAK